jgi:hypothetical protein
MHHLDPDRLPVTRGTVERFLLNGHGAIDGLLFDDGTEVHTPPHLSEAIARALKPGALVEVRGVALRNVDLLVAVAIDPPKGKRILDEGPASTHVKPHVDDDGSRWSYEGDIARLLHGPKGNVHGVLLDDGVIVRVPPHAAHALSPYLVVGQAIGVEGRWIDTPHGAVIHADKLGADAESVEPMPKHDKH